MPSAGVVFRHSYFRFPRSSLVPSRPPFAIKKLRILQLLLDGPIILALEKKLQSEIRTLIRQYLCMFAFLVSAEVYL